MAIVIRKKSVIAAYLQGFENDVDDRRQSDLSPPARGILFAALEPGIESTFTAMRSREDSAGRRIQLRVRFEVWRQRDGENVSREW